MGTNITGIGNANAIGFKSRVTGGIYFPPELKDALVGVWSAYGKSNDSTDRNIIKNKIKDRGGDFVISNAAFKLNSGFGGFVEDFTSWDRIDSSTAEISNDGSKIKCINTTLNVQYLFNYINRDISSFKVKISNFTKGDITYYYRKEDGIEAFFKITPLSVVNSDKVIELPKSYNTVENGTGSRGGFYSSNINIGVTIEQIPSFEGAFVTDGVNDLITSTKPVQEMGVTDEITIVSMIHQIQLNPSSSITNDIRVSFNNTSGSNGRIVVSAKNKTGIYGWSRKGNTKVIITKILGDKNDYSLAGENSTNYNNKFSVVGTVDNRYNSSVAWYWTIIANKVLTTDQINQVIAYYNLDKTLKPDILCNTIKQGISNENHAEFGDKLIDFSGNGRDIQLDNIAWDGDSGIGKYNYPNWKVNVTQGNKYARIVYYDSINGTYSADFKGITDLYKSYGLSIEIRVNRANTIDYHSIKEDGIYTVTPPDDTTNIDIRFGGENVYNASCDITITQIPSHAGALCLDGVNDFGQFVGDLGLKDYTVVIDRAYNNLINNQVPLISSNIVEDQTPFIVEHWNTGSNAISFSYGASRTTDIPLDINKKIVYQSTYSYMGYVIPKGNAISTGNGITLGKFGNGVQYSAICLWSLMLFPYSMSEFLIERQLKKYKLGTLYPNMVEFRPVIKSSVELVNKPSFVIRGTSTLLNVGDYIPENSEIWVVITMNNAADRITKFVINGNTIDIPSSAYNPSTMKYGFPFTIDSKSPQKITMTIEQDENYVKFEPVITSNVEYVRLDFYLNNYQKRINIGDYIPKDAYLRANLYLKNNVDELTVFTFNGVNIGYRRSSVDDTAFNINQIYNYDSPQEVNITIDEYIRYEDIVQPYPALLRFNDENGNEVSWGGKFRVGSTITRIGGIDDTESNLLNGLYSISGLSLNGKAVTSSTSIVEKQMVFRTTATWLLDNNEPKVILSPSRLRIPNSSYKILGYIPDISGHGNHGVIHNSAYAEGSGVNEDGSYQFDGVDDFITIPTTVGGKQVLMKVNWQSIAGTAILYDQRTNGGFAIFNRDFDTNENKVPAYRARNIGGSTYIDGILNEYIYASELKDITHNIVELCDPELNTETLNPKIGSSYLNSNYTQMSLYDFMLFDEISTDDKILELNEYVGIEAKVELPPYYWDTYGKTNSDADRDTIQQRGIAVGDYDLTNYNHAYEGMSGYNGYPIILSGTNRTYQNKASYVNVVGDDKNVINLTRISFNTAAIFSYVKQNGELTSYNKYIESFKIKVTGIDYSRFVIKYSYISEANATAKTTMTIASDGIYELPKSFASDGSLTSSDIWIGINFTKQSNDMPDIIEDVNVTIEVLPEYENGLAYDGVEDYSENVNIPIVDDFTFLVKASLLKGFTGSGGLIARKGDVKHVTSGGYAFVYCLDSSSNEANRNSYYSFGKALLPSTGAIDPPLIGYMTKTSVNGVATTFGTNPDIKGINFGDWNGGRMSMVVYKSMLYPKTIPLLQINFLKNLMEKDEIIDLNNPIFIQE